MPNTIPHRLHRAYEAHSDREVLLIKRAGMYLGFTYWQLWETIRRLTHGMAAQGIGAGDRLAILSPNRPEWIYIDYAAFMLRAEVTAIDPATPIDTVVERLNAIDARAVFIGSGDLYAALKAQVDALPGEALLFPFDITHSDHPRTVFFRQLTAQGEKHRKKQPDFFLKSLAALDSEQCAARVGDGSATLRQSDLTAMLDAAGSADVRGGDVALSTLNLSDMLERVAGNWLMMDKGGTVAYSRGEAHLFEDLAEVKPTVLVQHAPWFAALAERVRTEARNRRSFLSFGGVGPEQMREVLGGRLRAVMCDTPLPDDAAALFRELEVSVQTLTVGEPA